MDLLTRWIHLLALAVYLGTTLDLALASTNRFPAL